MWAHVVVDTETFEPVELPADVLEALYVALPGGYAIERLYITPGGGPGEYHD